MRNAFLVSCAVLLAACSQREKPPLSDEKFIELLVDFSTSEALYSRIYDVDTNALKIVAIRNQQVLDRHKVTKAQFEQTYRYYDNHKEDLLKIYTAAIDTANARKERLQKEK